MEKQTLNPLQELPERPSSGSTWVDPRTGKSYIKLDSLPVEVRGYISTLNYTENGLIAASDFIQMAASHKKLNEQNTLFRKLTMVLVLIMLMVVLIGFGLSFAVYELSKESTVGADSVMRHITDGSPVKTENTEMSVNGDMLSDKNGHVLRTGGEALGYFPGDKLTSTLSDATFKGLRNFEMTMDGSTVFFEIQGFYRTGGTGETSTVALMTNAGEIYLQGSNWSFSSEVAEIMSRAGFEMGESPDVAGRHLLFVETLAVFAGAVIWCTAISYACDGEVGCVMSTTLYAGLIVGSAAVGG